MFVLIGKKGFQFDGKLFVEKILRKFSDNVFVFVK